MKNKFTMPFVVMAMMFTVFLILANLMEVKVVKIGYLTATAGLTVFPVSYILNDCIVEIYGFAKARFVIWMGFFLNLIFVVFLQVCVALPANPHGLDRKPWRKCLATLHAYCWVVSWRLWWARW